MLATIVPMLLFAGWGLVNATGLALFWWTGPLFLYVVIPALDVLCGGDSANPPEELVAWLERDRYYRWVTYLFLPLQLLALVVGCWLIVAHGGLDVLDKVGIAVTIGSNQRGGHQHRA